MGLGKVGRPHEWRTTFTGTPIPPMTPPDPVSAVLRLVDATASERAQRALHHPAQGAQELHDLRLEVRDLIRAEPAGSPRRHVRPWVWSPFPPMSP